MQDEYNQAVKPAPAWMHELTKPTKEAPEPSEQLDEAILIFSQSDVWEHLKSYMNAKRASLASDLRKKADETASLDEIGFRFMSLDLLNKFVDQVIARVDGVAKIRSLENDTTTK
jgi:hypothetical protein